MIRFCANIRSRALLLDYIMHNDDMQVPRSLAHLVHNPRRGLVYTRRDRMSNRMRMYSRDRSRRT